MKIHSVAGMVILACAVILGATGWPSSQKTGPTSQEMTPASTQDAKDLKKECLGCHGPFAKIVEATAKFVAPSGEKTSPHKYIPHNSDIEEEIAECSECHPAHPVDPLPKKGSIDLSKVTVEWCYKACHHQKNFNSCKKCHI
jgi:hypothetical protein